MPIVVDWLDRSAWRPIGEAVLSQDCRNRLYLIGKGLPFVVEDTRPRYALRNIDAVVRIVEEANTDPIDEFGTSKPVVEPRDVYSYRATLQYIAIFRHWL